MKYSTAFFGKNSLNSLHSCAANVLLWANTSAGLPVCWITLAISSGASAVGVGSVVNKLDDLISMIAVVRGLKESLKNSIIGEKIS